MLTPHPSNAVLRPGHYALEISPEGTITKTQICPQKYFCPGGPVTSVFDPQHPEAWPPNEGSIKPCPSGMWTVGVGSAVVQQCCESRPVGDWSPWAGMPSIQGLSVHQPMPGEVQHMAWVCMKPPTTFWHQHVCLHVFNSV